ncbi:MAG: hypothetical protein WCX65_07125 [bacterium]
MILYIHPHGHLLSDNIIPHGAIYTINTIPYKKLGIYSSEISDELLKKAKAVLIDIHWPFAIETAKKISMRIKNVAPSTPIIIGGFIVDNYPELSLEVVPADYAVFNNAEIGLKPLIDCIMEGKSAPDMPNVLRRGFPMGPRVYSDQEEFNKLNFIDRSWFPNYFRGISRTQDGKPEFHMILTRGCCSNARISDSVNRCSINRSKQSRNCIYRTPEQLERDLDELETLFPDHEKYHVYLYAGVIEKWLMDEYLRVIEKPRKISIWMIFCQTISDKLLSFLEWKEHNVGIAIMLTCYSWRKYGQMIALTNEERSLLNRMLEQNGLTVDELEKSILSNEHSFPFVLTLELIPDEDNKRIEIKCSKPINWKTPPDGQTFNSDKEVFSYMCELGRVVNRTLPLRLLAPGIFQRYGFSTDPQFCMPPSFQLNDGSFHQSVENGMKKWGLLVPDAIDYRAIFVRCEKDNPRDKGYFYARTSDLRIAEEFPAVDSEVEVDESGWQISFQPKIGGLHSFENVCAVILPVGLESAIEKQTETELLAFDLSGISFEESGGRFRFRIINDNIIEMNSRQPCQ